MNYGEAFTYMIKGQNWISKILMGVLFALFLPLGGIGAIPLFGWSIAIGRRVIHGEADALPEWSELGTIIIDGLKTAVIWFVWNLPGLILGGLANLIDAPVGQLLFGLCGALYGLVIGILFLGVFGQLADDKPFSQAINPLYAWRVVAANWASTIIVWILALAGIIVASLVGTLLCLVGVVLGWTYGFALGGHLYGQLYRASTPKAVAF